jgi:hypothetical protein
MRIIDIGEDRFIVIRELSADEAQATVVKQYTGGILVRQHNTGIFLLCSKLEGIEFNEVKEESTTTVD